MEHFGENFKGGGPTKPCPVCEASTDTQSHKFQCSVLNENIAVDGKYLAKTVKKVVKLRENYMEN